MSTDDRDLFRQAMGDVKPLKNQRKVALEKDADADASVRRRREAAVQPEESRGDELSGDYVTPLDPFAISSFKRSGIQHGVFKNLRQGKYTIDARLDLHRMGVNQARQAVAGFIRDCQQHDIRCALISHGKGENRQPQPALLKSCVAHWLPQLDAVMAFHTAQNHHGGTGATYVLLKKSERKRLENLERHQKKKQ